MTTPYELGKRLKECRTNSGLSCKAVADRLEIDKSLYSRYENGERFPDGNRLFRLAEIFGVPIDTLISLPLKNTVIYPPGLLEELQMANISFGTIQPDDTPTVTRQKYHELKAIFDKVLSYRNEALDFPDFGPDLFKYAGQTIKVVSLDTRGEVLIDESLKIQMKLLEHLTGTSAVDSP